MNRAKTSGPSFVLPLAPGVLRGTLSGMDLRADHDVNEVDLDAELGPEEADRLRAVIVRSQEQAARGEVVPAEVLLENLDRILAEE
jgi:hypothetical protein